jgi:hypothetical protein
MGFDFRLPNITGATEREQLAQIKSFLHQHIEQLQWAMNNIDSNINTVVVTPTPKSLSPSTTASAEVTFSSIKGLIIKSADIVNAYYDEINNRLSREYIAKSDFGTYLEQNSQDITQNSSYIEQLFSNLQKITTEIENLNFTLADVNAHIRSGLLYEDENALPVYGLEIGQKNLIDGEEVFNKFARFTSDRLSFYDQNDAEVAYVSDYKLYIRNVEITSNFKTGGYIDIVTADGGVRTNWVGRG